MPLEENYSIAGLERPEITDAKVKAAMSRVARHKFVPEDLDSQAYQDRALPIGSGQTISQPFVVALMTQELQIRPGAKVLEIGTGSGYQAAVLAELGANVFSIELLPDLAETAKRRLFDLGYKSVEIRTGDGWQGWLEQAPFEAIIITAATPNYPLGLIRQLSPRGRMILPLEREDGKGERLVLVQRDGNKLLTRDIAAVKFVPLLGEARSPAAESLKDLKNSSEVLRVLEGEEKKTESSVQ